MTFDASNFANPFAPDTFQRGDSTPGLDDLIAYAVKRTALGIRVCLPAKVAMVRGPQFVDVQPLLQQRVFTELVDYPIVTGALVSMPVGGDYRFTVPLAAGDTGLLICADRALDAYIASDGKTAVDPASERCHNLTDAIFLPGLVPYAKQTPPTTDMVLQNGQSTIALGKTGQISFSNAQNELIAVLQQLVQALAVAQTLTAFGPAPFLQSTIAELLKVSAKLQTFAKQA